MKRLRSFVPSRIALFASTLLAGLPAAHALEIAGGGPENKLLINLDANDYDPALSLNWSQRGSPIIGDPFIAVGNPTKETIAGGVGLVFDGGLEYFIGPSTATGDRPLELANPAHTVEVWVYQGNVKGEETLVSWARRGGSGRGNMAYNYGSSTGAIGFGAVGHWGPDADLGWSTVPAAGQWHHLVYTYDPSNTTTSVYVDGVLNTAENTGPLNPAAGFTVNLGIQRNDTNAEPDAAQILSGGVISKVRIHNGVLNAGQVLSNYNEEKTQYAAPASTVLPRAPLHRFSFSNAAGTATAGSVLIDSISHVNGTVKGQGATFNGTGIDLPGGVSGSSAYVDLANGLISAKTTLTIEFWATQQTNQRWSRIFDFGNGSAGELNDVGGAADGRNYIFLSGNVEGTQDQQFERLGGAVPNGDTWRRSIGTTTLGVQHHYAVTYDDILRQWRWYRDGVVMDTLPDNAGPTTIADVNNWIGRSQWTNDANWDGIMNEFRIYNYALTETQIKGNGTSGPDSITPTAGLLGWQPTAGGTYNYRNPSPNDNWGTGVGGAFPNAVDAAASINSNIVGDQIIELNGGVTIGALSIGDTDGTNKFVIAAGTGGGALNMQVTVGSAAIIQASTSAGDTISAPVNLGSNTEVGNYSTTNPLVISGGISGAGNLTKSGSGAVVLTGDNTNHSGTVTVSSGQLQVGAAGTAGTLGSGAITVNANGRLVLNRSDATTVSNNINGTGQVAQESTGSVTYTGSATHTGITDLNGGSFLLQGTISGTQSLQIDNVTTLDAGSVVNINGWLGLGSGTGGTLNVRPGATLTANGDFNVGDAGTGSSYLNVEGGQLTGRTLYVGKNIGTNGVVVQTGGDMFTNAGGGDWRIGGAFTGTQNVYGSWRITGGTFSTGNNLQIGAFGVGIMEVDGGSVSVTGSFPVIGRFQNGAAESNGLLDVKSGSFNFSSTTTHLIVAEEGNGVLNVRGSGTLTAAGGIWVGMSNVGGFGTGVMNVINGGTVTTAHITQAQTVGSGTLNLDGGTIRASSSAVNFLELLDSTTIRAGGATFDTNGFDITIAQSLLAPSGSGVTTIPVLNGGTNYKGSPLIEITGGGGSSATAVANMTNGVVTSVTVTNPGENYTSVPSFIIHNDGFGTGFAIDTANVALTAGVSGGVTKVGLGVLTLNGINTYTGPTIVNEGTLAIGPAGSIVSSILTTVNVNATLSGTGLTGPVKVAGGTLSPGFSPGVLATGDLEFAGGTFLVEASGALLAGFDYDQVNVTGSVKISALTELSLSISYEPAMNDSFTLLLNDASDAVMLNSFFTFGGVPLPDGAVFGNFSNSHGNLAFQIDYTAGDGNDVVLSVVPEPGAVALLFAGLGMLGARRRRTSVR